MNYSWKVRSVHFALLNPSFGSKAATAGKREPQLLSLFMCVDLKLPLFPDGQSSLSPEMLTGITGFVMSVHSNFP